MRYVNTSPKFEPAIPFVGDTRNLALYLREIRRFRTLTTDEEADLARRGRAGDHHAFNRLVCANLKFVVSVCRNYRNLGLTLPELINEGNIGLIRAARRFDETRQFKFISYAVWWVRQGILQALADTGRLVKLPTNRIGMLQSISRARVRLEQSLGRAPTLEDLSEALEIEVPVLRDSSRLGLEPFSLDAPRSSDEDSGLLDSLQDGNAEGPEEIVSRDETRHAVEAALHGLSSKEESVVRLYFGLRTGIPLSLEEIGMRLGLTRERVRQIKESGLRKLRHTARFRVLSSLASGGYPG